MGECVRSREVKILMKELLSCIVECKEFNPRMIWRKIRVVVRAFSLRGRKRRGLKIRFYSDLTDCLIGFNKKMKG